MSERSLITLALIALVVSAVAAGYSYMNSNGGITGFAGGGGSTNTATVNLTISSAAAINFTTDNINFGSGRVAEGYSTATLITPYGNYLGNWTNVTNGFILENIGNMNASLSLRTGKNANTFLGGSAPAYQWNISNGGASGETYACLNSTGGVDAINLSAFRDVEIAGNGVVICPILQYIDTNDTIRIDVKLNVSVDSTPGALSDTFTAMATSA